MSLLSRYWAVGSHLKGCHCLTPCWFQYVGTLLYQRICQCL
jgi:hypothetical protein